jgi:hypothetical protein
MSKFKSLFGRFLGIDPGTGDLLADDSVSETQVPLVRAPGNRVVTLVTSTTLTRDSHAGKFIRVSLAAGPALVLPAAVGSGDEYQFTLGTSLSGSMTIKVASTSDTLRGHVQVDASLASNAPVSFTAGTTADTISLNGTTTGGKLGDYFKFIDEKTGVWHVEGFIRATGASATPFVVSV